MTPRHAMALALAACAVFLPADGAAEQPERVSVDLLLIDVIAIDGRNRHVAGLTADDFDVLIDGRLVPSKERASFEELCSAADPDATALGMTEGAAPHLRHIVLFFDFANLSAAGRGLSLLGAREFIDEGLSGQDRVMILAYKGGLELVTSFTSDPAELIEGMDRLLTDRSRLEPEVLEESARIAEIAGIPCGGLKIDGVSSSLAMENDKCMNRRHRAGENATREVRRARRSLAVLEQIMPSLEALPGRKAIVLFTDSLRQRPGAQYFALAGIGAQYESVDVGDDLLRLTREANVAGVSFYTVFAGGLQDDTTDMLRSRDDTSAHRFRDPYSAETLSGKPAIEETALPVAPGEDPVLDARKTAVDYALSLQGVLAAETGGRSMERTNNVGSIIASAREDLSCYYLLGVSREGFEGSGRLHLIDVRLRRDGDGPSRRGIEVRHRTNYIDRSPTERRDRLLRAALDIPGLYREIPVRTEAFALAPQGASREVLIKTSLPVEALALRHGGSRVSDGPGAAVTIRGEVSMEDGETLCSFQRRIDVEAPEEPGSRAMIVHETLCVLPAGVHALRVVTLDEGSGAAGARHSPLIVRAADRSGRSWISDIHLWVMDEESYLFAGAISSPELSTPGRGGYLPMAVRRMAADRPGLLSFVVCPRDGVPASATSPIMIERSVLGAGDSLVATLEPLAIDGTPDPASGCHQVISRILPGMLDSGVYDFTLRVHQRGESPLVRRASFAVD